MLKKIFLCFLFFITVMWVPAQSPRLRFAPDKSKIRVACIGDSITFGMGAVKEEDTYPSQIQKMLGDHYQVVNFGDSGRGIILGSMRGNEPRAFYKRPAHQQALAFNPDIVICNLGINDDIAWAGNGQKEFVPDYLTLLSAYQALQNPPKIFIWTKLAPLAPGHRAYDSTATRIPFCMRTDLNAVAEKSGAVGIDAFSPLCGADNVFQKDGIHPNEKGLKLLAESTFRQIKPWIGADTARLELSWYFADGMVVQRDAPVPVWGVAVPNGEVTAHIDDQTPLSVRADLFGRFEMKLPALPPGGPHTLTVKTAASSQIFKSVMSGDLWVCSGQSNLEFKVKQANGANAALADVQHINRSAVRILFRERALTTLGAKWPPEKIPYPEDIQSLLSGTWQVPDVRNLPDFPAIAYYFARELQSNLQVPVGIICIAVGGTTTESLISEKGLLSDPETVKLFTNKIWTENPNIPLWTRLRAAENLAGWVESKGKAGMPPHMFQPSVLAECGLRPLSRLPVKGFFFYQGESNATEGSRPDKPVEMLKNEVRLRLLIQDMRNLFKNPELPFYMIQLPLMNRPWETYRALQERICRENKAGICNILDLGDPNDVHPREKMEVGCRLAKQILYDVYGKKDDIAEGPFLKSVKGDGNDVEILFSSVGKGLKTKDEKSPLAFEIAYSNGVFKPALAEISGKDRVRLKVERIPCFIRYGWAPVPKINLVNSAGLPAFPFEYHLNVSEN